MKTACVSVRYNDYLKLFIDHNKSLLDDLTVITDPRDLATIKFCDESGVKTFLSNSFNKMGAAFNKGGAINDFLASIPEESEEWILLMDSDILLPKELDLPNLVKGLNKELLYGIGRQFIYSYEGYRSYTQGNLDHFDEEPEGFAWGYFQLWNNQSSIYKSMNPKYVDHYSASHSDGVFRAAFENNGALLELDYKGIHLGRHGVNHQGRVSQNFFS